MRETNKFIQWVLYLELSKLDRLGLLCHSGMLVRLYRQSHRGEPDIHIS
nr:MAG TPA: hypothetical protein [Caudoviricetes sp.]